MREQALHINNLLFLAKKEEERLHSLLDFPQDKLTHLGGSIHGLCMLGEAWNLKPSTKWKDRRKHLLCDGYVMALRSW